jgi:hypothetical protein
MLPYLFEIPNSKSQIPNKSQTPEKQKVWDVVLGIWCLFDGWYLGFGA